MTLMNCIVQVVYKVTKSLDFDFRHILHCTCIVDNETFGCFIVRTYLFFTNIGINKE